MLAVCVPVVSKFKTQRILAFNDLPETGYRSSFSIGPNDRLSRGLQNARQGWCARRYPNER